ncbi:MAG TPA: MOSC domain-containing protein, partial [Methylomirabilota bacterium]|nr:MOSC domain-containing protein [Methylomirabilota bacterium]
MSQGRIVQVSVSPGGVPKRPVEAALVTALGVEGDAHRDTEHHGGPERAVCLYALEAIEALQHEGHPIVPGALGENLTVAG